MTETLRDAQRFGFFGAGAIEDAIEHSRSFVRAIGDVSPGTRIVDLGSGGGLPGLVLASAYPAAAIVLVDRRQKRADFLTRAVSRLRWDHVSVACADVADLVGDVASGSLPPFDVATARGFGPPATTLRSAVALVRAGGTVVISEPPVGDRWDAQLLEELCVSMTRHGPVAVFRA